ncbi:MAG: hypothetical protein U0T33_09505 [Bacteroidales bacterium]
MKPLLFISAFLFISIILSDCNHKDSSCAACGVDNPTTNLSWLKAVIDYSAGSDNQSLAQIDLYEYNDKQLILLSWDLNGANDLPTGSVYNCAGDLLYTCGGNQPLDSCSIILSHSKFIGNIWEK